MPSQIVEYILRLKDEASDALKATAEEADKAEKGVSQTSVSFAGLATAAAATTAVIVGAVAGFVALQQHTADARNELTDMSTRTGIAAKTLAGLGLAAEGSGLKLRSFERGLVQLPKRMADAAKGVGPAAAAFAELGVEVSNVDGTLRESDVVFQETIKSLQSLESPTQRAAIATELFGSAGGRLMQALGTGELETFIGQAERFGIDVGPVAAKAAADWQREMAALKNILAGFGDDVASAFGADGGAAAALETFNFALVFTLKFASEILKSLLDEFAFFREGFEMRVLGIGEVDEDGLMLGTKTSNIGNIMKEAQTAAFDAAAEFQSMSDELVGVGDEPADAITTLTDDVDELRQTLVEVPPVLEQIDEVLAFLESNDALPDVADKTAHVAGLFHVASSAAEELAAALEGLSLSQIDLDTAFERGLVTLGEYTLATARLGAAADDLRAAAVAPGIGATLLQAGAAGAGQASAALTGDMTGAVAGGLALAGFTGEPISTVIMTAVNILQTVGEQGSEAIIERVDVWFENMSEGIGSIDEVMVGVIDAVENGIPEFLLSLFEALPSILLAVLKVAAVLMGSILLDVALHLPEMILRALRSWWNDAWNAIQSWTLGSVFEQTRLGGWVGAGDNAGLFDGAVRDWFGGLGDGFQSGGYIPRTQLALLHQGERVISKGGARTGAARRNEAAAAGGGGAVSVSINTTVLDHDAIPALVRSLERVFGQYGRGSSSLFVGG